MTVSEKTAIDLYLAGYPQPELLSPGIYAIMNTGGGDVYSTPGMCRIERVGIFIQMTAIPGSKPPPVESAWKFVYAPKATEILEHLPGFMCEINEEKEAWEVSGPKGVMSESIFHDDPAEACAIAYLLVNGNEKNS